MKKNKYLRVLITTLVVILGLSVISWLTVHLGQIFVELVSTSVPIEEEEKEQKNSSEILTLPTITLWTCQVGVYKDKQNADLMVESLRLKGWKAGIIKEDPYTIAIGAFDTKEKAALQGSVLAEERIEAWIRKESFPALSYKVSGKNAGRITVMLKLANSLLGGKEINTLKAELAGDIDFLMTEECPTDFQELNHTLSTLLNTDYKQDSLKSSYNQELLDLYLDYKLITTKYL